MIQIHIKPSTIYKRGNGAFISLYPDSVTDHEEMLECLDSVGKLYDEKPLDYEFQIGVKYLDTLLSVLDKWDIELYGNVPKKILDAVTSRNAMFQSVTQTDNSFKFKTKPFEHQLESFEFAKTHDSFLLGDEQGLGKTKQAIDIAVSRKGGFDHCLIVACVAGLKWNWHEEVLTHSYENSHIIGSRVGRNGNIIIDGLAKRVEDLMAPHNEFFLITNIESFRDPTFTSAVKHLVDSGSIGMTIVDEIHKCKNSESSQGDAIRKIDSYYKLALTGTPLMNTPIDIYNIMYWLGYEKHTLTEFKNHYCLLSGFKEIIGYKNLGELRERVSNIMLRRLKEDVLDLPPKIRKREYVDMNAGQTKIYKEAVSKVKDEIDKVRLANNPLSEFLRLRQATGYPEILTTKKVKSSKFERAYEIIEEATSHGGKVLVFSNWTQVINPFYESIKKHAALITGDLNENEKAYSKKKFMDNPNVKVLCGTIGAMGTGLTLTAAQTVIFLDEPWSEADKDQAEDRAHRIGTLGAVTIYTLLAKNTIDERINLMVSSKGEMSRMIIDGKVAKGKESDFVDFLLN